MRRLHSSVLLQLPVHEDQPQSEEKEKEMTREKLQKEKKKLLTRKPVMDTREYDRYKAEMQAWDDELRKLEAEEKELDLKEEFEKMEIMAKISQLQKQRANAEATIDALKAQYKCVGLDRRYKKETKKKLQWDLCVRIVEKEANIAQFGEDIEILIEKRMEGM